jgi:C4-dicarboxylate transporter, DctM subunit
MELGLISIVVLLGLVCAGFPVGLALFFVATAGLQYLVGVDRLLAISGPMFYNYIAKYEFSVIVMFTLLGHIGAQSGLFTQLFDVARKWFGRLPAGLAVSVVIAQTIFGACSGSSVAACIVIGKSSLPAMRKMGYPDELSTGVIAGSGTLAVLIPPSVTMCIYGLLVDESIGKLLIGGFLPGFLSAAVFITLIMIQSRHVPRDPTRYSFREKLYALRYLWVVVLLVLALIGGMYSGICTPTEGGAFGTFVMFLLALVAGKVNKKMLWESVRATISTTGMILIIIVAAVLYARFLTLCGFSAWITDWIKDAQVSPLVVFLFIVVVYLILGCFVGSTGMMVMTLPTFYPVMMSLGFDPIWFGIIVVIMCEMAFLTPPVGINLYATKSLADDIPLSVVIRGTTPFVFRDLLIVAILYVFPQVATFLPGRM